MSNKFKKGDVVNYEGQKTVIIDILKGKETKKQICKVGFYSRDLKGNRKNMF